MATFQIFRLFVLYVYALTQDNYENAFPFVIIITFVILHKEREIIMTEYESSLRDAICYSGNLSEKSVFNTETTT